MKVQNIWIFKHLLKVNMASMNYLVVAHQIYVFARLLHHRHHLSMTEFANWCKSKEPTQKLFGGPFFTQTILENRNEFNCFHRESFNMTDLKAIKSLINTSTIGSCYLITVDASITVLKVQLAMYTHTHKTNRRNYYSLQTF